MKVSVSLPADDVRFLDDYAEEQGVGSRSAAVQHAIRLLRATGLGTAYELAWSEWDRSDDAQLWERTTGDGLSA